MARQSPFMSSAQFTYPSGYQQRDVRYGTNSTAESAMALNRRPSLLAGYHNHFSSPERTPLASYYPSLGPMSMGPHVDEHSKRSRYLTGGNLSVNSQLLPLSVDVKKEQQVYQPQTEAISPTPDDPKNDSNIRDSTIIRNAISKLESEIDTTMKKLHRAKLSQSEIKSQADRSAADEEENDDRDDLLRTNGSQTLIEKILHDNRKKAEDSQKVFNHLNNSIDLTIPLYQEANDLESVRQIRLRYTSQMKNRLKEFFKKKHDVLNNRTKVQSNKYDQIYQQWQRLIEKEEKIISNKDTNTYRDIFEKTFPELRKTREDKEKKQVNPSDSSTSEPQTSVNTNSVEQELEVEEEKMRKSSVVPPILYNQWQRKHQYFNQNGLIKRDAAEFYKERTKMPYWSSEEKQIFIEKFTQSPKNFGYISSFLENKTTEQCVQFYYMTKKSENYKNLLRKQGQANRRKAKQQTTTTTTVTSSTTIETTLVTKVTSSNTIVSSTSQQMLDTDRSTDRLENDEERREINSTDGNEEKRSNKNRCQLLSCTTEKLGKKKNRKNRLRAFPSKWNELTKESREAIRRELQIPPNVQRCCTRCYEKLIIQVRQRQTTNQEEDDDDDESSKTQSTRQEEGGSKHNDEWAENEIHAFAEAIEKFPGNWTQIAEYVRRSEQSCRAFYQKYRKKNGLVDDEHNIDEDNGSISGSEDITRRLTIPTKSRGMDEDNDDDPRKPNVNEDSNDSTHGMIIDEVDEQAPIVQEKKPITSGLTTINSIVEKEISRTLNQSGKHLTNPTISPSKPPQPPAINTNQPPPLVALSKSRSPPLHPSINKGSIMRGTPISPSNKPISVDTSMMHSHHYQNPRPEYSHHPSHVKSSKLPDQQQLFLQQQQQQQQQQQAAYMRHYSPNNFPPQQHRSSSNNPQQTTNKSLAIDTSNNDTYETLRADFVTSRYLTTTHSPNHERQIRHPPEQRSPSQSSSSNQQLLPPPTAIAPPSSSSHPHHSPQQQAVLLAASQMLASSGMYPQELLTSGLLPYSHYYGSLPGASFYVDPRLMHDFTTATNNEQLKNLRSNRHLPHSPPDPSAYSSQSSKRHTHENIDHMRYPTSDYATSIWRSQNNNQQQQIHSQLKSTENPLLKLNELSRHSARVTSATDRDTRSPDEFHHRINQSRPPIESPSAHFQRVDTHNHHKSASHEKLNTNLHFSDHSSDGNPSSYLRQQPPLVHKPHASHPHHHTSSSTNRSSLIPPSQISPHHGSAYIYHGSQHSPVGTNSSQHHQTHHSQQRSSHHNESIRYPKESISIQEFMKQSVNQFVESTNTDNKHISTDLSSTDNSNSQLPRLFPPGTKPIDNSDQPILIDDNDDSNSMREQTEMTNTADGNSKNRSNQDVNKLTMDSDMPERRRDSSIKKILSNQPLEKQEYVEINQKVQNSATGALKVHSGNELNNLERANSAGARETTRSRGSITMRMLMGANGIYADGKAQPMTANELGNEQPNKRAASPDDKTQSLEYLIRGELVRACATLPKNDEATSIFQSRNTSNRLSPTSQQRMSSKRMRASPKDEPSSEQRHSSSHSMHEASSNVRDPFVLQTHSKNSHHQSAPSSSSTERNWQSYVQQQYQQSFATRTSSRPPTGNSGSITQGSPISPPTRLTTEQQQHYPSTANNQLINPRYAHYMNKNESQFSASRRSPTSPPIDHSVKGKFARRAQQSLSSSSDTQHESSLPTNVDQTSNLKSPSPISAAVSPTTSVSSTSAHPLKKRLISEYELEQQRNSPAAKSPTPPSTKPEPIEEPISNPTPTVPEQTTTEEISNVDTAQDSNVNPNDETESSS